MTTNNNAKTMCFGKRSYKGISCSLLLDLRNVRSDQLREIDHKREFSLMCRVGYLRKSSALQLDRQYTLFRWEEICDAEMRRSKKAEAERNSLNNLLDYLISMCRDLADSDDGFSFDGFRKKYFGLGEENQKQYNVYSLWKQYAEEKTAGTARSYLNARNRFIADMGQRVKFSDIDRDLIERWKSELIDRGVSIPTINNYLRIFSIVLNEAERRFLLPAGSVKHLFHGVMKSDGSNRRKEYLKVEEWQQLWKYYVENEDDAHSEALGLFLFMYLANGLNMRDLLELRYDSYYYSTGGRELRFVRAKTRERAACEVEIPILPELRLIINRFNKYHGAKEKENALVFPYLKKAVSEIDKLKIVQAANYRVRFGVSMVAQQLGMRVNRLSATWARHSFATNLAQMGVDRNYISWAMAHTDNSITGTYIDNYSYEKMTEYNSMLLHGGTAENTASIAENNASIAENSRIKAMRLLENMSRDEIEELLKNLSR